MCRHHHSTTLAIHEHGRLSQLFAIITKWGRLSFTFRLSLPSIFDNTTQILTKSPTAVAIFYRSIHDDNRPPRAHRRPRYSVPGVQVAVPGAEAVCGRDKYGPSRDGCRRATTLPNGRDKRGHPRNGRDARCPSATGKMPVGPVRRRATGR